MDGAGDRGFATGTGFAFFAVDGQVECEVAGTAIGIEKIA